MQVLVADDEITSRVTIETALRERGHTVRNSDDGVDTAKILAGPFPPKIAIVSNTLAKLRGLDVCRFLCASGRKSGVYVILIVDVIDMELVELCRRAGVDDVLLRKVTAAGLHSRLDVADRVVALEAEIARVRDAFQGIFSYESSLDKKVKALRDANAALLGMVKKKVEEEKTATPEPVKKLPVQPSPKPVRDARDAEAYRGISFLDGRAIRYEPPTEAIPSGGKSLSGDSVLPNLAAKSRQNDVDTILAANSTAAEEPPLVSKIGSSEIPSAQIPSSNGRDEAQSAALAGAEEVQNAELADEEIIHPFEFDEIILKVFSGMGVTLKSELPPKPIPAGPVFTSWVGVTLIGQPLWLDIVMAAGEDAARAVTRELLGQAKVGDSDICEMFAELQNIGQGAVRRYLEENGYKNVLQLTIPRALKRDALPDLSGLAPIIESGFSFKGGPINVTLYQHRESATLSDPKNLLRYDLLCEPVVKDGSKDKLLIAGVIFKDKEQGIVDRISGEVKPFKIMHVSPLVKALDPEKMLG